MNRYSALQIFRRALGGNRRWQTALCDTPQPKKQYQAVIVGGGGHGLATAYYLAKEHNIRDIAVVEQSWLGGGNTGRNTTIIRSNYMMDGNTMFYERALRMWEQMSRELNFNVMASQRGIYNLCHTPAQLDAARRRGNVMRGCGIDAELLDAAEVRRRLPIVDFSADCRFPIVAALHQPRAGTARHDAVVWGYARAANALGVDIIQQCRVVGFLRDSNGSVCGVQTTKGDIRAAKTGIAVAGNSSILAQMAGIQLPMETHTLQAFVSEPLKPLVDTVITFGAAHFYISQSDKGGLVMGGDLDGYNSYSTRGALPVAEDIMANAKALIPATSNLKIVRQWAGAVDMTMDGSPFICQTPIPGLYLNGGWCYGGFKATPASGWCFAWTMAHNKAHSDNAAFNLERFARGEQIDEKGAGAIPAAH